MATMFPESVTAFGTEGEKRVFRFLRQAARPDALFWVWYGPDVRDREPDFILLSPDSGLIVWEVKDWMAEQIVEANPKEFRLRMGTVEDVRKNPLAQAREYSKALLNLLHREWDAQQRRGRCPFPVTEGVVLANITRQDFFDAGLDQVLPENKMVFWDDLHEHSPLYEPSGQRFQTWLRERFPPLFAVEASAADRERVRRALFPIVRIATPLRSQNNVEYAEEHIRALDHCQEQLARDFRSGKCLITGPAGSGKTLVLAHQAWHLPRVHPRIRKILFTCFNLSLPGYIRRLLAHKQVSLGPEAVTVLPLYDLCEHILGEKLVHAREQSDYYELVVQEALAALLREYAPLRGHWDAILVDEGQDFSADMARLLTLLLHPGHGVLNVALDTDQALYVEENPWADLDQMRLTVLGRQYRSSRKICALAGQLLGHRIQDEDLCGPDGPEPLFPSFPHQEALLRGVAEAVAQRVRAGTPMAEIAVIYTASRMEDGGNLPLMLTGMLEERGVLAQWAAEDERAKRRLDVTADTVKISSIHTAKGLDFRHVFLLGLDGLDAGPEKKRRLAYTGMTRARYELIIPHVRKAGCIPLLVKR